MDIDSFSSSEFLSSKKLTAQQRPTFITTRTNGPSPSRATFLDKVSRNGVEHRAHPPPSHAGGTHFTQIHIPLSSSTSSRTSGTPPSPDLGISFRPPQLLSTSEPARTRSPARNSPVSFPLGIGKSRLCEEGCSFRSTTHRTFLFALLIVLLSTGRLSCGRRVHQRRRALHRHGRVLLERQPRLRRPGRRHPRPRPKRRLPS